VHVFKSNAAERLLLGLGFGYSSVVCTLRLCYNYCHAIVSDYLLPPNIWPILVVNILNKK